eukprot:58100-Pyramimonas_sp.AAC.1
MCIRDREDRGHAFAEVPRRCGGLGSGQIDRPSRREFSCIASLLPCLPGRPPLCGHVEAVAVVRVF